MSEKSYLVIPSKIPTLGLSSLTLLGSLWSISSDILYSIIYGLFLAVLFFFFWPLNSQHLRVGPGER